MEDNDDFVAQVTIKSFPLNSAINRLLKEQSNMADKITKLETKLTAMEGTLEKILKVVTGNVVVPTRTTSTNRKNQQKRKVQPSEEEASAGEETAIVGGEDDEIYSNNKFKPIKDIDELNDFELQLKNAAFRNKTVRIIARVLFLYISSYY